MKTECSKCGYPYTNGKRCSNCGSKDPKGFWPAMIVIAIFVILYLAYV